VAASAVVQVVADAVASVAAQVAADATKALNFF